MVRSVHLCNSCMRSFCISCAASCSSRFPFCYCWYSLYFAFCQFHDTRAIVCIQQQNISSIVNIADVYVSFVFSSSLSLLVPCLRNLWLLSLYRCSSCCRCCCCATCSPPSIAIMFAASCRYRFTQIVADAQIKTPGGKTYDVLFVGTGESLVPCDDVMEDMCYFLMKFVRLCIASAFSPCLS